MSEMIQVVHKRPALPAEVVMIENTLEALQRLLDGGYLCGIHLTPSVHGYVDDDGLSKELPLNFVLDGEPIVGPAVFSKADSGGEEIGFEGDEGIALCKRINELGRV
jgi:hypothetical protein